MADLVDLIRKQPGRTLLDGTPNAPGTPSIAGLLEQVRPQDPSLLDIASNLFRADVEGTSLGAQMDAMQQNRAALAQQDFQNAVTVADFDLRQTELLARQGQADATAVLDAFKHFTKDIDDPQVAANLWVWAKDQPGAIDRTNAMSTFAQGVQELGITTPRDQTAPITWKIERGDVIETWGYNALGEADVIATAPRWKPPEPGAPTVETFYDEEGLPYKAEWNNVKREWVRIGGSKAGGDGGPNFVNFINPASPDDIRTVDINANPQAAEQLVDAGWVRAGTVSPGGAGGGPTPAQEANNAEVLQARSALDRLGMTPEQIVAASTPGDMLTPNPAYNPYVSRLVSIATQRLTGVDDPDFESVWGKIYPGTGTAPSPAAGGDVLPTMAGPDGSRQLDRRQLVEGRVYQLRDGLARWDGSQLVPVE